MSSEDENKREVENADVSRADLKANAELELESVKVVVHPHSELPKPEPPPGIAQFTHEKPKSIQEKTSIDMKLFGKFFREKSNSFSAAIAKRLSSLNLKEIDDSKSFKYNSNLFPNVTEFHLSGLKVIVKVKSEYENNVVIEGLIKGRISFFSRSNCRDSTAVRTFLREKGFKFVEINIDVYPMREKELVERTGKSTVPQIFFNEKLLGGLVAFNSLRKSGLLEQRLKDILCRKCPDDAPASPVYGFDDPEDERLDEMVTIVRVLRQKLPIQDRLMKMKIVKNCFAGADMVEIIIHHFHCDRKEAVEIGKKLARKHFIHHVFGENEFEDGSHCYRFLEHESFISRCFNIRGVPNDLEPKRAASVSHRLTKIMVAILESYSSEDRLHLDYMGISNSEEFRRYVNLVQDLQRMNIGEFLEEEKLTFFLNLYNAMVIHAIIRMGARGGVIDRRTLYSDFQYVIGGYHYSLGAIKNGILRGNKRPPYSLTKSLGSGDRRLEFAFGKVNPLIHFGLCDGTRSSPSVRFFTPQGVESELRNATREFFQKNGMEVDLGNRTVYNMTRIINWFDVDIGQSEKEMLKWLMNFLDCSKAGLLSHLLEDGGSINVVYQNYDWSVNS
ncbi:uncharacterized protein LOC124910253 [Impatiens glandulifera]|uniref:uncharacterized protein LOC124910253 n=1 Tax=Impatiens glandulifera TaxID=253017 RepID=UPI001FB0ED06|nr:uncharacterized protein LOC124910253 [Impatiens glandulifera]